MGYNCNLRNRSSFDWEVKKLHFGMKETERRFQLTLTKSSLTTNPIISIYNSQKTAIQDENKNIKIYEIQND